MIRRDYDGINTLLVKEKKAGCTNWRTKTVYTLKPTAIHQIISEREYTYSGCSTMTRWADRWYHYDLLGSVTALTDDAGQVIAQYEQDAYGNGATPGLNRHLTCKELDPDTGLYYFGARWYDPRTAQWIQPEPTGADGPNLYWYGRSRTTNGFDWGGYVWYDPRNWPGYACKGVGYACDWIYRVPACQSKYKEPLPDGTTGPDGKPGVPNLAGEAGEQIITGELPNLVGGRATASPVSGGLGGLATSYPTVPTSTGENIREYYQNLRELDITPPALDNTRPPLCY